jgi:hypothetical protein
VANTKSNIQSELNFLEKLDFAILFLNEHLIPEYLTSKGAKILGIKNRFELTDHVELLDPLTEIAARFKKFNPSNHNMSSEQKTIRELSIKTIDGIQIGVIAYAINCRTEGFPYYAVFFHTINSFEPFFTMVEQIRNARSMLIDSSNIENSSTTDLMRAMTCALNITDKLISSTVSITLDIKTSALLAVERSIFVRIISHLLVEAADFLGSSGKIKIKTTIGSKQSGNLSSNTKEDSFAEIVIFAQKEKEINSGYDLLETYIRNRCLPSHYHVTIADEEPTIKQLQTGEQAYKLTSASSNISIAPETYSDDLNIATLLAKESNVELQIRRPDSRLLVFYCQFPLFSITA